MAKTKNKRTVSDLDAQSIESFLNGGSSSYDYDSYSSESYSVDPILGQEVLDVLEDTNTDHAYFMMESLRYLGEATNIQKSIEYYIQTRQLKIKMCNAFSKSAKAKGYGIEAIDFWRSMEDDTNNQQNQQPQQNQQTQPQQNQNNQQQNQNNNKNNDSDDVWYKKMWAAITAFFKKLVMAVINFIKTIGNFIKGAICKAQDLFYKKYAKDVKANIQKYANNPDNKDLKFKCKSASETLLWANAPWVYLKAASTTLVTTFAQIQQGVISGTADMGAMKSDMTQGDGSKIENAKKNVAKSIAQVFMNLQSQQQNQAVVGGQMNIKQTADKIQNSIGKWFPPVGEVCNIMIYGAGKPSKRDMPLLSVVNASTIEILSPAALTSMSYAFKTAQQANKSLSLCYKTANKMANQGRKFGGDEKSKANMREFMTVLQNGSRFTSSMLITLYGICLTARMTVFSAAKKLYKKGEYNDEQNNNQQQPQQQEGPEGLDQPDNNNQQQPQQQEGPEGLDQPAPKKQVKKRPLAKPKVRRNNNNIGGPYKRQNRF